jgi:hypothetical protein
VAERRPKHQGLERVLGTGALFSTAYGNVGSSIYYALGLVAVYALGMTPLVFLISGLIFAATAATYAEATAMYAACWSGVRRVARMSVVLAYEGTGDHSAPWATAARPARRC